VSAALAFLGATKRYGGRAVVDGVELELKRGEIHALLGENGAGKTTLARMALGLVQPDAGEISVDGVATAIPDAAAAARLGIGMVHQHFTLAEGLTVAENLLLADAPRAWRRRDFEARAKERLAARGLDLDPARRVGLLPVGLRQRLEIAKALDHAQRVLLLDEPTAVLTPTEGEALFEQLRALRAAGLAIALITHRLDDALRLADRVTVLRAGRVVHAASRATTGTTTGAAFDGAAIVRALFGDAPASLPPAPQPPRDGAVRLSARGLVGDRFGPIDLELRAGERVVITGVDGHGQGELLETLAGIEPPRGGTLAITAARRAFIAGDRRRAGLALPLSIAENVALARGAFARPWFTRRELHAVAAPRLARFDVRASGPAQPAGELSGGNQQRVVLARELAAEPELLLAENPTRGLDLQASAFVQGELLAAAARGAALLVATTDLDEALALASRLLVIVRGKLHPCATTRDAVAELLAREATR